MIDKVWLNIAAYQSLFNMSQFPSTVEAITIPNVSILSLLAYCSSQHFCILGRWPRGHSKNNHRFSQSEARRCPHQDMHDVYFQCPVWLTLSFRSITLVSTSSIPIFGPGFTNTMRSQRSLAKKQQEPS